MSLHESSGYNVSEIQTKVSTTKVSVDARGLEAGGWVADEVMIK